MGDFVMPSLGSQMIEAKLVQWHVKPGDKVKKGDIIGEIDTEKGLIDIEVFEDGTITELRAKEGETIPVGSVMAIIGGDKEHKAAAQQKEVPAEEKKIKKNGKQEVTVSAREKRPPVHRMKASPLARRVAEDLHVDLGKVKGSGPEGTIHKKDVEAYARETKGEETFKKEIEMAAHVSAATEAKAPKSMRQSIAAAMSRSNREIPHYYLETEIDMTAAMDRLEEINRKRAVNERILPPMLLIKAVANALTEVPELNGFWTDEVMHVEEGIHIGFAISLRQGGLVIPAVLNADMKSLDEIRTEFVDMIMRAREGHLKSREISSATITITSLGERGAEKVFGVIYPPQVALVGFGRISPKPIVVDGLIGIRPVLSATLAGDHRATDGHTGSRFLEKLNEQLQHPEKV